MMKKTLLTLMALLTAMTLIGTAAAEASGLPEWLSQGLEAVTEAAQKGWNALTGTLSEWTGAVKAYMEERNWDSEVEQAWNTLVDGAEHAGSAAREEIEAAYETVRDWMDREGSAVDEDIRAMLDGVADAAGSVKAKISGWASTAEAWFSENRDGIAEDVREAWQTVRQGARDMGSVSVDKLREACRVLNDWIDAHGDEVGETVTRAIKGVLESLAGE